MWGKILTGAKKAYGAYQAGKTAKDAMSSNEDGEKPNIVQKIVFTACIGCFIFFLLIIQLFFISSPESTNLLQAVDPAVAADSDNPSNNTPGSASAVVNCAREQIGKPYIWAAEGPDSFDCSGLVTYCYRTTLNVEIPHFTGSQMVDSHFTTVLSANELSAGDIILDGGLNPSHVGIYSGEGTVIHAPTFNDIVKEVSLIEFYGWVGGNETFRRYNG